jgi:hypothetical protein
MQGLLFLPICQMRIRRNFVRKNPFPVGRCQVLSPSAALQEATNPTNQIGAVLFVG